jgi:hypothetical protein
VCQKPKQQREFGSEQRQTPAGGRLAVVACLRATACGRSPAQASGRRRVRASGTDHSVSDRVRRWEIFLSTVLLPVLQSHHSGMGVRTVD